MTTEASPIHQISSLAEGESYEAQGFISSEELKGLATEAFMGSRIPFEEYYSFIHRNDDTTNRTTRRDPSTIAQTIRNSKIIEAIRSIF
jgi:hypothetical protein